MADLKSDRFHISIATSTLVKIVLVGLALWFLYIIRDILTVLFIAIVFAALMDPFADWFSKRHIPRGLAVLIVYIVFFGSFALGVILIIPAIVTESRELGSRLGDLLTWAGEGFAKLQMVPTNGVLENFQNLFSTPGNVVNAWSGIFNTVTGFFGGIVSFFMILVLSFYLVVEEDALRKTVKLLLPFKYHTEIAAVTNKVQKKVGDWLKGVIFLGFIIGVVTYVALIIAGMPYALVLAVLAGITELIPYVGPVFAAIPAVFLGVSESFTMGLVVLAIYVGIQQLENLFLVPKVMQRAVGLNPVVSIVALIAGFKVGGVLGALIALPIVVSLEVIVREYLDRRAK